MSDSSNRNYNSPFRLQVMVRETKLENSKVPLWGRVTIKHDEIDALVSWLREQRPDDYGCTDIPLKGWWKESGSGEYISAVSEPRESDKGKPSGMKGRMR
tara:strand:- start:747 stop:1046 length:300 start_codon:yes stop_codon:yes gene_type:complete